eukprot:CAMPEP_0181060626 /NCGR_PEP_ID=MMETSP1070-20121207/22076_1 /TAXON_ID=265543 /ORGANISM="Minutocellus polymorphus, Strain NH13" /LENGTH=31 /DNA_ID= /DNA_START= /DNA_END= /DNA_ORIENTATION=
MPANKDASYSEVAASGPPVPPLPFDDVTYKP